MGQGDDNVRSVARSQSDSGRCSWWVALVILTGIGDVALGRVRQGYDLQLTRYDERGWRATFDPTGMAHSVTSAIASAWERTPWHAVQGAARDVLRRAE